MLKQVGILGAGQMGSGIAHVFAQTGYEVVLFDIAPAQLEKSLKGIEKNLVRQSEKGIVPSGDIPGILGRIRTTPAMEDSLRLRNCHRGGHRARGAQAGHLSKVGRHPQGGRHPRLQYLLHSHYAHRLRDEAARAGYRHALHESGADDEAGGGDTWSGDE